VVFPASFFVSVIVNELVEKWLYLDVVIRDELPVFWGEFEGCNNSHNLCKV
jgi:hypothetical protein